MRRMQRVKTGADADKAGRDFEAQLTSANDVYRLLGIANVHRLPVETVPAPGLTKHIVARAGQYHVVNRLRVLAARQMYDYSGSFGANAGPPPPDGMASQWWGRSIAMEAKHSTATKTSLPIVAATSGDKPGQKKGKKKPGGSGLSAHQLEALVVASRDFGVAACVIWRNGPTIESPGGVGGPLVLLPPALRAAWEEYTGGGRKSVPVSEFVTAEPYAYGEHGVIMDWLYPLRQWLDREAGGNPSFSVRKAHQMIQYQVDAEKKTVVVFRTANESQAAGGQKSQEVPVTVIDNVMFDEIARTSPDADAMISALQRLKPANG